jgi:DNA-binding GntR family transcriptional regulator
MHNKPAIAGQTWGEMPRISVFLSKKDHVKRALLQGILSGEVAPGTFLRQNELAVQHGLSSTPVREALAELQSSGLLQHHAHRGFCVAPCDAARVRQVYAARRIVEPQVARAGLAQVAPGSVQALIDQMANHLDAMHQRWEDDRLTEMAESNNAFHLVLFECSDNPFLVETVKRLWNSLPRFVPWQAPGRMAPSIAEHHKILDAVAQGDPMGLVRAYETHLDNAQAVFLEQLAVASTHMAASDGVTVNAG